MVLVYTVLATHTSTFSIWQARPFPNPRICRCTLSILAFAKLSMQVLGLANLSVAALILCMPIPLFPWISQIEHPDACFGKSECCCPCSVVLLLLNLYYPHT